MEIKRTSSLPPTTKIIIAAAFIFAAFAFLV